MYKSFSSLFKFISRYCLLEDTIIINHFHNFFSDLLPVFRNSTDVCMFILYSTTLLNSFIRSNSFLVDSLGFSFIGSYLRIDGFTYSFLIWVPFFSFACLIALASSSSTVLNISCECSILVLFLILGEEFQSFTIEHNVSRGFFINALSLCWEHSLPCLVFWVFFYHERMLDFVKCLYYIKMIMWFFFHSFY